VLFALTTMIVAGIMLSIFPSKADLPIGYKTPIIAFEFARSQEDVMYLMGDSQASDINRKQMRAGHRWDMVFPFAYGLYLVCLLVGFLLRGKKAAWIGIPVALACIPFDLWENIVLLSIVDAAETGAIKDTLFSVLHLVTWLSISQKRFCLALVSITTFLLTLICYLSNTEPVLAEAMALGVSVFMLVALISTLRNPG